MNSLSRTSTLVILMLLLTACASSPPATEAPTPAEATEPSENPTETAAATQEEAEGSSADGATVAIANFSFGPDTLTVKAGTTVTWRNNEDAPHTVTADDESFSSSTLSQGDSFSFTFETPGTYDYHCQFHGGTGHTGMSGTIIVEE